MERPQYVNELKIGCRRAPTYFNQLQADGGPMIGLVGFDDFPAAGRYTYFSYGLHLMNKPEWIAGRPEYFITIDKSDRAFALFFAYLLSTFAPEKVMGWNTLIGAGDDDAVDGYPYRRIALGPPEYLGWGSYQIDDPNSLPINLGMAYFVSDDDFATASKVGIRYLPMKMQEDRDYWWKIQKAGDPRATASSAGKEIPPKASGGVFGWLRQKFGGRKQPDTVTETAAAIAAQLYAQHGLIVFCSRLCIGPNRQPVQHAIREPNPNVADSGWIVASGNESDAFANDPSNYVRTPLNRLLETDPTLRILYEQPPGTELTRRSINDPWRWIVDDKVVDEDGNVIAQL
jgi:hypothetical protein